MSVLQVVVATFAAIATLAGLVSFTRGCFTLAGRIRQGQPAPQRLRPVCRRTWTLIRAVLFHQAFKGRPFIRFAHWVVMVSFPLLFTTLITGYAQLVDAHWHLPILGRSIIWGWLTDIFAWAGLFGIIALMVVRSRAGRGRVGEASAPEGTRQLSVRGNLASLPSRFLGSTYWQARFVEFVIAAVVVCVLFLRGLEATLDASAFITSSYATWVYYPLTWWFKYIFGSLSPFVLGQIIAVISAIKIIISMSWMLVVGLQTNMGVAWHRFLAFITIYARRDPRGGKTLGAASPLMLGDKPLTAENIDDIDEETILGAATITDFTWKGLLDFASCTECGRCQELCPAWTTGKPLSPKLAILALRDHHAASSAFLKAAGAIDGTAPSTNTYPDIAPPPETDDGNDFRVDPALERMNFGELDARAAIRAGLPVSAHSADVLGALKAGAMTGQFGASLTPAPLVGEVISPEALWDCTMCGACVEQCPVDIEHLDYFLEMRRHQVLMESAFPRELGQMMRKLESKSNPYGMAPRKRLDWAKKLPFEVPILGVDLEDATEVDYLFWVGCAGAFDDRAKKVSAAVAQLLHTAGISFAVLGDGESCTGDPARRAGNEILFQMLAAANIETFTQTKVRRIVVTCAHCFNTISNEYAELGGNYEVVHHTELLSRLVDEGKLVPRHSVASSGTGPKRITYHDPCYLGRHNRVFTPPRELLASIPGVELVEMERSGPRALCCGAGGARAWMEETRGSRIADTRASEAAATRANMIATACPFCTQMLATANISGPDDATAAGDTTASQPPSSLEVNDISLLLLDSVRPGQDEAPANSASS